MGVWGDGIFDGDGACDFLGDTVRKLQAVVDEGLDLMRAKRDGGKYKTAELGRGFYAHLHDPVVPAVAMLHALLAKIRSARVCLDPERVRRWKRDYFAWYAEVYVPVNGPCPKYRRNIARTFDNLTRLADGDDSE